MRDDASAFTGTLILQTLSGTDQPVPRRKIIEAIKEQCALWSYSTCSRRFRDGRAWLVRRGVPIVSTGAGFFLASEARDFNAAAIEKERMAKRLWHEARRLRRMAPSFQVPSLFEAAW